MISMSFFHVAAVFSKFFEVLTKFLENPYNNFFLNSVSVKLLPSISFISCFWRFLLLFFICGMFLCFSILAASVCLFLLLDRSAMSLTVVRLALCSR